MTQKCLYVSEFFWIAEQFFGWAGSWRTLWSDNIDSSSHSDYFQLLNSEEPLKIYGVEKCLQF